MEQLAHNLEADLARPLRTGPIPADHPIAFLCAEFGIHASRRKKNVTLRGAPTHG